MFGKKYEDRLLEWSEFRQSLEHAHDPIKDVIEFYNVAPTVSIHTDPWDKTTWPDPWELLEENQYCDFCRVLGMCYSLQLTDRFNHVPFEIHIVIDNKKSSTYYLLHVGNLVIGYTYGAYCNVNDLPKTLHTKKKYSMERLQ
jgi:hypothetical protein